MKILILVAAFFGTLSVSPERLVDMEDIEILYDCDLDTTEFYKDNLEMLWGLDGRFDIKLKMATCSLPHKAGEIDLDTLDGFQHPVAVAINRSLEIIGTKAALPCPPHCSGKEPVSFQAFMVEQH